MQQESREIMTLEELQTLKNNFLYRKYQQELDREIATLTSSLIFMKGSPEQVNEMRWKVQYLIGLRNWVENTIEARKSETPASVDAGVRNQPVAGKGGA